MSKKPRRRHSIIFIVAAIGVSITFLSMFFKLQINIKERRNQADLILQEYEQLTGENERLRGLLDEADEAEIIERYARENRGYAYPDERFYYDVTPGK